MKNINIRIISILIIFAIVIVLLDIISPEVPIILLIIATPIYFLSKFILKKRNLENKKNIEYLALIPTVIITPIIYASLIISLIFYVEYYPKEHFDKQKWDTNIEERYIMSNEIVKSEMLIGKTREEVIEILGNERTTSWSNEKRLEYYLGCSPAMFLCTEHYLEIIFENGKVIEVLQHTD